MRALVVALVILVVAIFLGLEIAKDPGTVFIQIRGWTIEASLAFMAAALIVLFAALYALTRLLGGILRAPRTVKKKQAQHQANKAQRALNKGMLELAQGNWQKAEKQLGQASRDQNTAVIGYLAAARAAQERGSLENRDKYLQLAHQSSGNTDVAVGITEAQLLIDSQQLEQAAHKLRQLNRQYPKNRLVLNLLKECYLDSHAWQDLAELMPQLEKHKVVDKNEALHLERTAYGHLLSKAAHASDDSRALDTAWSEVPHGLRRDKELLTIYIRYLLELGETSRPESILRHKIKTKWDDGLVHLYGLVTCDNPAEQLKQAERWLKKHQENATLLLTLGRLSLRNHMWAKARTYLEKSAEIDPRPETYMLLGKLLEQTGDAAIAGECFRKGLGISVSHDLLLERTPIEPASEEKQALAPVPPPAAPAAALAGSTA